jgi:hypothetical protein
VIVESETTLNVAPVLSKLTALVPVNAVPLIVTEAPTGADAGVTAPMLGAGSAVTVNEVADADVPALVVTVIGPLVAAGGTTAVNWESDATLKLAAAPLKATALVPLRPLPETVTEEPGQPDAGVKEEIVGAAGGCGGGIGNGVAVAPLLGAVPRLK